MSLLPKGTEGYTSAQPCAPSSVRAISVTTSTGINWYQLVIKEPLIYAAVVTTQLRHQSFLLAAVLQAYCPKITHL